ncbi:MAG: hypothetical protein ACXWA9_01260 [Acidimicrobiia bacterium]
MTTIRPDPDRLYKLLPALYRIADVDHGGELQALLELVTQQADAVRNDTQQLWDDFFIETAQRWVIPYIGDLIGNIPLHDLDLSASAETARSLFPDLTGPDLKPPGAIRTRADVANTIFYRRRKGTPTMLEKLARDVTGWGAHVVEFFSLLDWNQFLEHLRPDCHGCPDLRRVDVGDRVGGPWDSTTHTVDVRRISRWEGWHNISNIGFFLWRLRAYRLTSVTPRPIGGTTWRLTFSPLGQDIPLFSAGDREPDDSRMATELTVEAPIRPVAFFEDLSTAHATVPPPASSAYYGSPLGTRASLAVFVNGTALGTDEVACANLDNWTAFSQPTDNFVRVDVKRGRLLLPTVHAGKQVTVSYFYGFSAPMGGGEYDRSKWLVPGTVVLVSGGGPALDAAIAGRAAGADTVIQVTDDATYDLTSAISLAANESLVIQAANEVRPHVRVPAGSLSIVTSGAGASLTLGGLLLEGRLAVDGDLDTLRVLHTTFVPGSSVEQEVSVPPAGASIVVAPGTAASPINTRLSIEVAFSILGALRIPAHVTKLWLLDSIIQGVLQHGGPLGAAVSDAANLSGPPAHIERSTVFGTSRFLKLELGSESIFTDTVTVDQRQKGCVRFSYVPDGSSTPQQYRCQPALEIALEQEAVQREASRTGLPLPMGWEQTVVPRVSAWLRPSFTADRYGNPAFAQLGDTCPPEIRTGAEDGSEMGAFCVLKQPQREANLRIRLDEYLPVGLDPGVIHVT